MLTLREHLEAIRDALEADDDMVHPDLSPAWQHAVAALTILNASERDMFDHETGIVRIVPDFQPGVDLPHLAAGWKMEGSS